MAHKTNAVRLLDQMRFTYELREYAVDPEDLAARRLLLQRAGYLPAERKNGKPSFREAGDEALARFANRSTVEEQSFQLELEE